MYSAKRALDGAKLGVEEKPSADIATLLVNMLGVALFGFNEFGPKIIQGVFQAVALTVMFFTVRKIFGKSAALISVIVASFYLSSPFIAKFGNVKEQFMTATMIVGISLFALRYTGGKWYLSILAGAVLAYAPLFKPTGMSAIGAVGLFTIVQPILKNRTVKQTLIDILLLFTGAIIALSPLYIWMLVWDVKLELPYSFVWYTVNNLIIAPIKGSTETSADYVVASHKAVSLKEQAAVVFRFYRALILPVSIAIGAIICRIVKLVLKLMHKPTIDVQYDRLVLLLGLWWIFDMILLWASPRPYEQYYIPLNGSAAMLGAYLIAAYNDKMKVAYNKLKWQVIGLAGILIMIAMAQHIFFGVLKSPATGYHYGERRRGYVQKWQEISKVKKGNLKGYWEIAADYIRQNSTPKDRIYVWGWIPAIYVRAQRISSSASACTSEMHVYPPEELAKIVQQLIAEFEEKPPKFIVDTHNKHFPYDNRPPLELWPNIANGIRLIDNLPNDRNKLIYVLLQTCNVGFDEITRDGFLRADKPQAIERYEKTYRNLLQQKVNEEEARRFEAMKPLRDYIMKHYHIAQTIGEEVIFERNKETQ